MMSNVSENKRASDEQGRRRRRSSDFNGNYMRLGVDENLKDPAYEYRWINDDRSRLEARTKQDDWDFVDDPAILADSDKNEKTDTRIRRVVGQSQGGAPMYAYLCRKRKEWCDEDRRAKADRRMQQRQQMIKAQHTGTGGVAEDPRHTYIPEEAKAAIAASPELRRVKRA
jgi:hypothetical protein